ncbi:hypothetical protein GOBAR_AA16578 [Gossypium barbadense]|uniref:Uncharacterized protein n=1 Tax=Gossypium barbadense TaxID=3634 RepID=A0A2P5XLC6_GOSBA|nr:hypothetical protein GOBAR_AA16578 [Gossypium barbadense]
MGKGTIRPVAPTRGGGDRRRCTHTTSDVVYNAFTGHTARQVSTMILPQVHLRKPCYDFSFLLMIRFSGLLEMPRAANCPRRRDPNTSLDHSIELTRQIAPPTKKIHAPPPIESRKSSQSVNPYYLWTWINQVVFLHDVGTVWLSTCCVSNEEKPRSSTSAPTRPHRFKGAHSGRKARLWSTMHPKGHEMEKGQQHIHNSIWLRDLVLGSRAALNASKALARPRRRWVTDLEGISVPNMTGENGQAKLEPIAMHNPPQENFARYRELGPGVVGYISMGTGLTGQKIITTATRADDRPTPLSIVHHISGPYRHAITRTLLRRSRSVGDAPARDPANQLSCALQADTRSSQVPKHTETACAGFHDRGDDVSIGVSKART